MSGGLTTEEHALFEAACSARLDGGSRARLEDLLRTSVDTRRRYLDYMSLHADLFGAVRVARVHGRLSDDLMHEGARTVAVQGSARSSRRASLALLGALATAAAVLFAFTPVRPGNVDTIVVASTDDSRDPRPVEKHPPSNQEMGSWPGLVARVNRVEAAQWCASCRSFAEADLLAAGDAIALEAGLVEIEFRQGALVLLEGPAELIAENANAATLLRGKLAAVAPPWATGFRVDTPGLDVVDHGTEFAVSVSGEGKDAQVNVVVTDGEVEVLADQQAEGGRRLRAGEGVQSKGASVQDGDDANARRLAERLPERPSFKNAMVVGDRWADWAPGAEGQPRRDGAWRHLTNHGSDFGDPTGYEELVWDSESGSYRPAAPGVDTPLDSYVRVHRDGGHPGRGAAQAGDERDHYSITAFIAPEDGAYRIEAGWLERLWAKRWDQDQVLDVAVHVNDGPVLFRQFCNRNSFVAFSGMLGDLTAGDTIYVGVGPNGVDFNDKFRWGFYIVRETDPPSIDEELAAVD